MTAPSPLLSQTADQMRAQLAASPEAAAALIRAGAQAGLPDAQAYYGQLLLDGQGVAAAPAEAFRQFGLAAASGHVMAINMVGRCHEKGWGTPVDPVAAAACYRRAAEAGLDWGMYNWGSALGLGAGVAQDEQAALGWFQKAAALGHAKSINFLGAFHEEGRLLPRDMDRAGECYRIAAEGGDFRGQFNHGRLLADAGDIAAAAHWMQTAATSATPAFRAMMRDHLAASPHAALRVLTAGL